MIALAWAQLPFNAAALTAPGALRLATEMHCAFFAASAQREKFAAAPKILPPLAAAMHASQA
jgi:hypothetical protein